MPSADRPANYRLLRAVIFVAALAVVVSSLMDRDWGGAAVGALFGATFLSFELRGEPPHPRWRRTLSITLAVLLIVVAIGRIVWRLSHHS